MLVGAEWNVFEGKQFTSSKGEKSSMKEIAGKSLDDCKDACLNERSKADPCVAFTLNEKDQKCDLKTTSQSKNMTKAEDSQSGKIKPVAVEFKCQKEEVPPGIKKLSTMLDPAEVENRKKADVEARQTYNQNFGQLDLKNLTTYLKLFEILWYSQLPCFDVRNITSTQQGATSMLKQCYWKGQLMNCPDIFTTRPTDKGMCCTFNMKAAEKLYKASQYKDALGTLQVQDKTKSFQSKDSATFLRNLEPHAGLDNNLAVILDAHRDLISPSTVLDSFRGFTATIHAPNEFPMTSMNTKLIKPGQENLIGITVTNVKADKDIRDYPPEDRNCFFSDEFPLKIHQEYSQSNCLFECGMQYAKQNVPKMNSNFTVCIPWFYPVANQDIKMCDPWEQRAFQKLMSNIPKGQCNKCLPDCNGNIIDTKVDRAAFQKCDHTNLGSSMFCNLSATGNMNPSIWSQEARSEFKKEVGNVPEYLLKSSDNKTKFSNRRFFVTNPETLKNLAFRDQIANNPTYDAFENDIAMVKFYFEKSKIVQFNRKTAMTPIVYVSQMGGLMGFGMGFSLISAAEIVYWMTIRFLQNCHAEKRGNKRIAPAIK